MTSRFDDLAERLDALAEELADAAYDAVREAIREGQTARPISDKRLSQARRAVEKAAHLVRGLDRDGAETDEGYND